MFYYFRDELMAPAIYFIHCTLLSAENVLAVPGYLSVISIMSFLRFTYPINVKLQPGRLVKELLCGQLHPLEINYNKVRNYLTQSYGQFRTEIGQCKFFNE